jgi:hypothetical protein
MQAAGPRISPNRFARQLLHVQNSLSVGRSVGASNENTRKRSGDLVRPQIFLNAAVLLLSRDVVRRQGETQKVGVRAFSPCGKLGKDSFVMDIFIFL